MVGGDQGASKRQDGLVTVPLPANSGCAGTDELGRQYEVPGRGRHRLRPHRTGRQEEMCREDAQSDVQAL